MTELSAAPSIEPPSWPIGRRSTLVADPQRDGRLLGVDVWYPAVDSDAPTSEYELFPGFSFAAAAARHQPPPAPGLFPLIVFSHGRTGMRFAYSLLCEALAARGSIVVSADHPGDGLTDWLLGSFVDDRTNEMNRVGDAHALLAELRPGGTVLPADLIDAIDHDRVVLAGHSYGAYTALATSAGARGVPAHDRVRAAVGLQPYTRSMSDGALGRVTVPTLLIVSEDDITTPASSDADRPWALLRGEPTWRVDLAGAGHQAASDMGLYAEFARHLPMLPQFARDYLGASADAVGSGSRPWRELLATQVGVMWAFLQMVFDLDAPAGAAEARRLGALPDVTLRIR